MKHAREDYNRIQDPAGLIPEDEPVFLIRAQDMIAPFIVQLWAVKNKMSGGDPELTKLALEHAEKMEQWQKEHGSKPADLEKKGEPII